jgi:hypothetical protein
MTTGPGTPAVATATATRFRKSTQPTIGVSGTYNASATITTAVQPLTTWFLPPVNILRGIALEVTVAVPSTNSATVAFNADAPQNLFSVVNFCTAGGTTIVGSFDGYTAAIIQKYGGYARNSDIRNSAVYSAVTGSGATGGNVTMVYRIPVEVTSRSGLGSLSSTSTEAPLQLQLSLNSSTAVYSTAPTALPVVTVKGSLMGYWPGPSGRATPRNFGTTQFWTSQTYNALNGAQNYTLQAPPGMSNPHRNWVAINRIASSGARSSTNFPSPLNLQFRGNTLYQTDNTLWVDEMSRVFGYQAALDAINGLDTGVYVIPFDADFTYSVGSESGDGYLDTANGDPITFNGTWGASCNLTWLVNFLNVVGGQSVGAA